MSIPQTPKVESSEEPQPLGSAVAAAPPASATIRLHTGHALTSKEGNELAGSEATRLIALVGPTKSGKTTFLLSIYEEFRQGRFSECIFAGSKTLLGFEERCHLSRAASNLPSPDTERTKSDTEEVLVHLRVLRPDGIIVNSLYADLSGELFEAAGQTTDALLSIPFLGQANYVAAFVDGALLVDATSRHAARQQFMTLLRAGIEAGLFSDATQIAVVFSKQDLVEQAKQKNETREFQDAIEKECMARFSKRLRSLTFHRISCRPVPVGLAELFEDWLSDDDSAPLRLGADLESSVREIDRFRAYNLSEEDPTP